MENYTAQAVTEEKAIQEALEALNLEREEAEITVLQTSRNGFLGFGKRKAIVSVSKIIHVDDVIADVLNFDIKEKEITEEVVEIPEVDEKIEIPVVERKKEVQKSMPETEDSSDILKAEDITALEPVRQFDEEAVEEVGPLTEAEIAIIDEKAIHGVKKYVKDISLALGVEKVEIEVSRELQNVYLDIKSDAPGLVIGRHGKVLDAIHTLAQIHLHNFSESKLFAQVDSENYRGRREDTLRNLSESASEQVLRTHEEVILENLSGKERKVIHRILSKNDAVKTYSEGQEPNRYLVVSPVLNINENDEKS